MTWKRVENYSLGFKPSTREFYFYFALQGESATHQLSVSAQECSALGDMFRNEGPISYNTDGAYFVTAPEVIGEAEAAAVAQI